MDAVPFDAAPSMRNPETSIGVGQRFRSSTYWVSEDPLEDHMTSLMTTVAEIFEYESGVWALFKASFTFQEAAETEVVPYVTVPLTFSSISFPAIAEAEEAATDVPEKTNQSLAGVPENASESVTTTFDTPS